MCFAPQKGVSFQPLSMGGRSVYTSDESSWIYLQKSWIQSVKKLTFASDKNTMNVIQIIFQPCVFSITCQINNIGGRSGLRFLIISIVLSLCHLVGKGHPYNLDDLGGICRKPQGFEGFAVWIVPSTLPMNLCLWNKQKWHHQLIELDDGTIYRKALYLMVFTTMVSG